MADIIQLLPETVANQIAAGEVVQQASSVIKELVENAVDAGASHIDIQIVDSGKTLIQVIDNGKGMSHTDARMAFERHATSKIRKAEDVYALHTMGFRGEALPSIAAVSHVVLRTRQVDQQLGTKVSLEGGELISQEHDMCQVGTSFAVSNLFFNLPARRANLLNHSKSEHRYIIQEFERMALVNPSVGFTFYNNGTIVYDLPVSNTLQRIVNLFGKKVYSQLLPVEVDTSLCRISGYVGRPDMARKKGALQYLFVNGRFMRHPYFHKAVCEAFADLIPEGEQIPYFLYFDVDPSTIDVNISPSKTEINFQNQSAIWQIVISAIKESLGKYNAVPVIDFDTEGTPNDIPVYNPNNTPRQSAPEIGYDSSFNPFASPQAMAENSVPASAPSFRHASVGAVPSNYSIDFGEVRRHSATNTSLPDDVMPDTELLPSKEIESLAEMEKSSEYYQYRGQYIFIAVRSGLMIIDQHRAHMCVLYHRYRAMMEGQSSATQGLLFPEILRLSASDAVLMDGIMDDLHNLGFDLSPLGGGSFSVLGVPASLGGVEPISLLTEIVESVRDTGKSAKEDVQHRLALAMARHASIAVGEVLSRQQMEALVEDLFATKNPGFAPDGKVAISILPQDSIDKLFR